MDNPDKTLTAFDVIKANGIHFTANESFLEDACMQILQENPAEAELFRNRNVRLLKLFMGKLMKKTGGQIDPKKAAETFQRLNRQEQPNNE
jgi:Asp-tRNA(Asn)/Glu-tRNA(Gln) amidotransferase B subunit